MVDFLLIFSFGFQKKSFLHHFSWLSFMPKSYQALKSQNNHRPKDFNHAVIINW